MRDRDIPDPSALTQKLGPKDPAEGVGPAQPKPPAFGSGEATQGNIPDIGVQLPTIEAPKGGGAIRAISERFAANAATGTGSMSVGLGLSPGRNGFGPSLALSYDSGAGNSPYGLGWSSGLGSVQRKTSRGVPRYVDGLDTFVFSGGEDLIAIDEPVAVTEGTTDYSVQRYRPRVERSFERIERWTRDSDGDTHWRTYTPNDVCAIFGRTASARVADPANEQRVYQWLLEEQWDGRGSAIHYEYKAEDLTGVEGAQAHESHRVSNSAPGAFRYLKRVHYGNTTALSSRATALADLSTNPNWRFEVVFDYGEHTTDTPVEVSNWDVRPDPFSTYRAGFEVRTYRLAQRVLMFHRFPELGASAEADGVLVRSTVLTHGQHVDDGAGGHTVEADPTASKLLRVEQIGHRDGSTASMPPVDLEYSAVTFDDQLRVVHKDSLRGIPGGVDGQRVQWVDLDGEGLPGALVSTAEAWWYKRPEGAGELGDLRLVQKKPIATAPNDGLHQLVDLQGDGRLDLVRYSQPMSGYFEQTGTYGGAGRRTGFGGFKPIPSVPNVDFQDPNLRFLDVTGDGRADLVLSKGDLIVCYRGKGADGFEAATCVPVPRDERAGPRVVFADPKSTIFTADMTGDGLSDIVRIEAQRVCYWPNLGHGRFGARVTMSNAPLLERPHQFDASRVKLADLDGTGPADLIYLHPTGVVVYTNRAGNSWAPGREVQGLPLPHNLADVQIIDLLGRGTACLVWSSQGINASPRLAYVDLFGRADDEQPPPSAYKPHLLIRVTNNTGAETRIRYTPSTKFYLETRGTDDEWVTRLHFPVQVVDRVEYEDFVRKLVLVQRYAYHHGYYDPQEREFNGFGYVEQWDEESYDAARGSGVYDDTTPGYVPPIYTRSWFHTGSSEIRNSVERALLARSGANPDGLDRLEPTVLPASLSLDDERDACRALRGQPLRNEVYGLDGTAAEALPYVMTETQSEVHVLYEGSGDRQTVFGVMPRQTRTFHTEREGSDVRVVRELTMEIKAADLPYGHVARSASVAYGKATGPTAQTRAWVQHSDATVEHHDTVGGVYRIRMPARARSWEAEGLSPGKGDTVEALRTAIDGATQRLLADAETLYWNADQTAERTAGETDPAGFVRRARALAVPSALQTAVFGTSATPGYAQSQWTDGGHELISGDVWAPTPRIEYRSASNFHLPYRSVDPFGNTSEVTFDTHNMFAVQATNALSHVVSATIDYHALAVVNVVDPNLNHVEVELDPLGVPTKIARKGKDLGSGQWEGRTLSAPHQVFTYARREWFDHQRPNYVSVESFTSHDPAETDSLVSYMYADGSGQEILTKAQAEPGPAPLQDSTTGALIRDAQGELQLTGASATRWVGSGRVVLDNKGNPVKQYEPYFSSVSAFDDEAELIYNSPAVVLHYDPLGRPVRTQHPDGTEERVERFTWSEVTYDASDTVLGSKWETDAAASSDTQVLRARTLSLVHDDTPSTSHLDAMGRPFQVDEDNGTSSAPDLHSTTTELDIQSRALSITDARSNVAGTQTYDTLGRVLTHTTADGGSRWMLPEVDGQALRGWDERTHVRRMTYDALRRPVSEYVATGGGSEELRVHQVYGEALGTAAAQAVNLLGAALDVYDSAGVQTVTGHDFDGNPVGTTRRLRTTPAGADSLATWSAYAAGADWSALPGAANLATLRTAADADLESETFTHASTFDALGRPAMATTPDSSVARYGYNDAGLLELIDVDLRAAGSWTAFVTGMNYDAQGRRTRIGYGNGSETTYDYDALSRRLTRLKTQRSGGGTILQDLGYTYDAAGNIVALTDGAQQTTYFDNAVVSPDRLFEYDARHRLVRADGRCHPGQQPTSALPPERSIPHPNDSTTLQAYVQTYAYDEVGNILEMHQTRGGSTAWRRRYQYAIDSNRLVSTSDPADSPQDTYFDPGTSTKYTDQYTHDPHGSITALPGLLGNAWNDGDELQEVSLGGGGNAYYLYSGDGLRIRKVIRRPSGAEVVERLYFSGWELYRRHQASTGLASSIAGLNRTEELETFHVMEDSQRISMVESLTVENGAVVSSVSPVQRFQIEDHLGTCSIECASNEDLITYEEYFPYGPCAYQSRSSSSGLGLSIKRYRFNRKERDEETGMDYFGARYFLPWLGRWSSADPALFSDGTNQYVAHQANPLKMRDVDGRQAVPSKTASTSTTSGPELTVAPTRQEIIDEAPVQTLKQFIESLKEIEAKLGADPEKVLEYLLERAGANDSNFQAVYRVGKADRKGVEEVIGYEAGIRLQVSLNHEIVNGRELGLVIGPSGKPVALGHVITGLAAGVFGRRGGDVRDASPLGFLGRIAGARVDPLYLTTIAGDLAQAALEVRERRHPGPYTGPSMTGEANDAQIRGDLDGFIIGSELAKSESPLGMPISSILESYYYPDEKGRATGMVQVSNRTELFIARGLADLESQTLAFSKNWEIKREREIDLELGMFREVFVKRAVREFTRRLRAGAFR